MSTAASAAAAAQTRMQAVNRLFEQIVADKNIDAFDRVYTEGARLLPPGAEMIAGRAAIKEFWRAALAGVTSAKLETVELNVSGDIAVEIGRATLETVTGPVSGKYVVCWKQEDGAWKLDVDTWNLNS